MPHFWQKYGGASAPSHWPMGGRESDVSRVKQTKNKLKSMTCSATTSKQKKNISQKNFATRENHAKGVKLLK